MGQCEVQGIGKVREFNLQLRMICRQMFEGLRAGSNDSRLQSSDGVVLESRGISEIADHASGRGRQARVGLDVHEEAFEFSGHGWWPERRRKLPGSRGNSRDRRSKGAPLPAPCR